LNSRSIYAVSAAANDYRTYLVADDGKPLQLVQQPWGRTLTHRWRVPSLIEFDKSGLLARADFASVYLPNLLIANARAAHAVSSLQVELLPAMLGSQHRYFLNWLQTVSRLREDNADLVRVPGAILFINRADLYAEDVPVEPHAFWYHDGNAPRFLLCNDAFKDLVAPFSGLSFAHIGYAY
jgi:hypothetical protein